jgi:probable FeS assembly SUF system protein SufT
MAVLETVQLKRNVKAVLVSDNFAVMFPKHTRVIVQEEDAEGFTVKTYWGDVARIDRDDGDALGSEYAPPTPDGTPPAEFSEDAVWFALRTVYDPEIPVNVVDLGLIYNLRCADLPDGGKAVTVVMTLTAPGCGMSEIIKSDVEAATESVPGVKAVDVNIVFDPPWDVSRMTDAAKLELGLF